MDNPKMIEWRNRKKPETESVNGMVEISVLNEGDTFRKGDNLFIITEIFQFVVSVICLTNPDRSCRLVPSDWFVHQTCVEFKEV